MFSAPPFSDFQIMHSLRVDTWSVRLLLKAPIVIYGWFCCLALKQNSQSQQKEWRKNEKYFKCACEFHSNFSP
jgi:hypothetical protein